MPVKQENQRANQCCKLDLKETELGERSKRVNEKRLQLWQLMKQRPTKKDSFNVRNMSIQTVTCFQTKETQTHLAAYLDSAVFNRRENSVEKLSSSIGIPTSCQDESWTLRHDNCANYYPFTNGTGSISSSRHIGEDALTLSDVNLTSLSPLHLPEAIQNGSANAASNIERHSTCTSHQKRSAKDFFTCYKM